MWAARVPAAIRPPILNENHADWPWPFKYIPRSWNAWISDQPPLKVAGSLEPGDTIDIPDRGRWVLADPPYFALTTRGGWHFRFGIRYDFVDRYYVFPAFTLKGVS